MKNKASLAVLLMEIIAIVIMHSARSSRPDSDKPASTHAQSNTHFTVSGEKQPILYTTLR